MLKEYDNKVLQEKLKQKEQIVKKILQSKDKDLFVAYAKLILEIEEEKKKNGK